MQPLFVDVYAGDVHGDPDWGKLALAGAPWHGAIIKATEGDYYAPTWFDLNWQKLRATVPPHRYGYDWFRGAYHFLKFNIDGRKQADLYLKTIERAGGMCGVGDLFPMVDVEMGGERNSNRLASRAQVEDCTTSFAHRVKSVTGRDVVLYGSGAMRDLKITSKIGCTYLWFPRWTDKLPMSAYNRIGWKLDDLLLWQYCGDGVKFLNGYPNAAPGFGRIDISVFVKKGGLDWLRENLWDER